MIGEQWLADYLKKWYDRVLRKYTDQRTFRARVATVSNVNGKFICACIHNGQSAPDTYLATTINPFYAPQVGDDVMCFWIDDKAYVILAPMNNDAINLVGMFVGAPTGGVYNAGDIAIDSANGTVWVCTGGGSPGSWISCSALNRVITYPTGTVNGPSASPAGPLSNTAGNNVPGLGVVLSLPSNQRVTVDGSLYCAAINSGSGVSGAIMTGGFAVGYASAISATSSAFYGEITLFYQAQSTGSIGFAVSVWATGSAPTTTIVAAPPHYTGDAFVPDQGGPGGYMMITFEPLQ